MLNLKQNTVDTKFNDTQVKDIVHYILKNGYSIDEKFIQEMKKCNASLTNNNIRDIKKKIQKLPYQSTDYLKPFCLTNVNIRKIKNKCQRKNVGSKKAAIVVTNANENEDNDANVPVSCTSLEIQSSSVMLFIYLPNVIMKVQETAVNFPASIIISF